MAVDPDLLPTVADVAALMLDRADPATGTFNTDTRPTASQVNDIIVTAAESLDAEVADDAAEQDKAKYRTWIVMRAAILVEMSNFSDEGTVNVDRINTWERMADRLSAGLAATGTTTGGGSEQIATWVMK